MDDELDFSHQEGYTREEVAEWNAELEAEERLLASGYYDEAET